LPGRRPHAERLARHLSRRPRSVLHATFRDNKGGYLLLRCYWRLGSSDAVESRAEEVEGRLLVEGAARTPSAWFTTSSNAPARCCTHFSWLPRRGAFFHGTIGDWDRATRSKEERKGSRVVFFLRAPPARRALGSLPPTRPARCSTQLLGLPMVNASFYDTIKDWDRATRSKAEQKGWRVVSAWLTTFNATRSVLHAT
jgi:hypothetical protein